MCAPPPDGEFTPTDHVAGQRLDRPVTAPPGWPTIIAVAAAEAWSERMTAGRSPRDPRLVVLLVTGWASAQVNERSGQARARRLGFARQADLPPGFSTPGLERVASTLVVTTIRLGWWRLRTGRAQMPLSQRTWSRAFTRRIITAGVMREEWNRRLRQLTR